MTAYLTVSQVKTIHEEIIKETGGSHGIRDYGLLESAVAMPQAAMGGEYLHGDLFEMAAAYLFHIVKNHPFVDGNKRTGAVAALVFLEVNGVKSELNEDELVNIVVSVAEEKAPKHDVAAFLRQGAKET